MAGCCPDKCNAKVSESDGQSMNSHSLKAILPMLVPMVLCIDTAIAQPAGTNDTHQETVGDSLTSSSSEPALVDRIISDAMSYLGVPYVYGGTGSEGFDCSGLAYRVFGDNGVSLPRTVTGMESIGEAVDREDLIPGDLIIFHNPSHVGLYIGDGQFIHCSSYLDRGVVITELSQSNYDRRYHSARRVLPTE